MIHVVKKIERPSKDLILEFQKISSATVCEAMNSRGALSSFIHSIARGMRICGPVLTVKFDCDDNLMIHKAMDIAEEGDIIVAACGKNMEKAVWGELMTVSALARGIQGFVTDSYVRDSEQIIGMGFPVFARGFSIRGTSKEKLRQINFPIYLTEILVNPGDLIIGDDDGIVVIPISEVKEVLAKSISRIDKESQIKKKLQAGHSTLEILGLEKVLKEKGLKEE